MCVCTCTAVVFASCIRDQGVSVFFFCCFFCICTCTFLYVFVTTASCSVSGCLTFLSGFVCRDARMTLHQRARRFCVREGGRDRGRRMSSLSWLRGSQACLNCLLASKPLICKLAPLLLFLSRPSPHPPISASYVRLCLSSCFCMCASVLSSPVSLFSSCLFFSSLSVLDSLHHDAPQDHKKQQKKTKPLLTLQREACSRVKPSLVPPFFHFIPLQII